MITQRREENEVRKDQKEEIWDTMMERQREGR